MHMCVKRFLAVNFKGYTSMSIPICEHLKPGGTRCGSPAVHGKQFCYYHLNLRHAMPMTTLFVQENPNPAPGEYPVAVFDLPLLEDPASIQIGFMQLIHGVAHGRLEPRRARLILSALHGAAANLRLLNEAMPRVSEDREKKPVGKVEGVAAGRGRTA